MYALFKDDKQISKSHKRKICCVIEALERKLIVSNPRWGAFWWCSIKKIEKSK
jgi:hypothetical protein